MLEPEVTDQLPPEVYAEQLQMAALTLDLDDITQTVRRIRQELSPDGRLSS